jgi:hypothetical protein
MKFLYSRSKREWDSRFLRDDDRIEFPVRLVGGVSEGARIAEAGCGSGVPRAPSPQPLHGGSMHMLRNKR